MSSTNRACNPRHANDYYRTDPKDILTFLKAFEDDEPDVFIPTCHVLDPAAGGDPENSMSYPEALNRHCEGMRIDTMDVRDDSLAEFKGDYLKLEIAESGRPDVIITNPPFSLSQQFITKALSDVARFGFVIMLQRINFLGSDKRLPWWHAHMPTYIYVHSARMGFITKYADRIGKEEYEAEWIDMHPAEFPPPPYKSQFGKKDSIEYAHYVWKAGEYPRFAQTRVI